MTALRDFRVFVSDPADDAQAYADRRAAVRIAGEALLDNMERFNTSVQNIDANVRATQNMILKQYQGDTLPPPTKEMALGTTTKTAA